MTPTEKRAMVIARSVLVAWQNNYAKWQYENRSFFDKRFPPAGHVLALELLDESLKEFDSGNFG